MTFNVFAIFRLQKKTSSGGRNFRIAEFQKNQKYNFAKKGDTKLGQFGLDADQLLISTETRKSRTAQRFPILPSRSGKELFNKYADEIDIYLLY